MPGPGEHEEEGVEPEVEPFAGEEEEAEVVSIDQEQDRYDFKAEWFELDGWLDSVLLRAAYSDYEQVELEGSEVGTLFEQTGVDARLHLGHRTLAGWDGALGFQYTYLDLEAELEFPLYESAGRELHGRVGGDYVRGTNLLDEELRRHASPLKEYVPLPGRSLMVGLRADF